MMMEIFAFIMAAASLSIVKKSGSIKMVIFCSLKVMIVGITIYLCTSDAWFPLISILILLGGIMVLFSVVSSITPNTPNKGAISNYWVAAFLATTLSTFLVTGNSTLHLKACLESPNVSYFITLMILAYFCMFTMMLSMETGSLRS